MHATESRGRSMEATATETAATSNWSSPATTATLVATTLRFPNQSRARKKRDPIEFSFHDLDFLCLCV
jgi:hypothetical protein